MFRKRKPPPPRNLLTLVPERCKEWTTSDSGTVVVHVPRFGHHRIGRWFSRRLKVNDVQIDLDRVGTAIWQACDGHTSVEEIGVMLQAEFGDDIEPVYDRLGLFFRQLEQNEFIRWVDAGGTEAPPSA